MRTVQQIYLYSYDKYLSKYFKKFKKCYQIMDSFWNNLSDQ